MVKYTGQNQGTDKGGGHVCHGAMSWRGCRRVSRLSKFVTDARMWRDPGGGHDRRRASRDMKPLRAVEFYIVFTVEVLTDKERFTRSYFYPDRIPAIRTL